MTRFFPISAAGSRGAAQAVLVLHHDQIHAVVDTNELPIRLALTAGEAHDNRLAGKLFYLA
jgi:hypothetical protein